MIIGRSPLRISFSGGGTDLEEYHLKHTGFSISATINKFTYVLARTRNDNLFQGFSPDFASHLSPQKYNKLETLQGHEIILSCLKEMNFKKGVDMFFCSDVSPGSGLGASSALTANIVNVILYLQNKTWDKNAIASKAYKIGHDILKWGIGKQDEYSSVYGGINFYKYFKKKVTIEPIILSKSTLNELQNNSLLFYLGDRKPSSNILNTQLENIKNENSSTMQALENVKKLTLEMHDALKHNDLIRFSSIIKKGWEEKKNFAKGISNKKIDKICEKAYDNGADAVKVTGAGGGGHLFVFAEKSKHSRIINNMKKYNVKNIDFHYQTTGSTIMEVENL